MLRSRSFRWLAIAATLACLCSVSAVAWAQSSAEPPDTFWVNYYSNANTAPTATTEEYVWAVNPGTYAPQGYPPNPLCAMIYVFDNRQEMKECCGCYVSPNGLLEARINRDLTANPFNGILPHNGDIKLVSTPLGGYPGSFSFSCDPTGGGRLSNGSYAFNLVPVPDLRAWAEHLQIDGPDTGTGQSRFFTEDEFQEATLGSAELDSLEARCTDIRTVGSGAGVCTASITSSTFFCQ
jgi:hypothetical protein